MTYISTFSQWPTPSQLNKACSNERKAVLPPSLRSKKLQDPTYHPPTAQRVWRRSVLPLQLLSISFLFLFSSGENRTHWTAGDQPSLSTMKSLAQWEGSTTRKGTKEPVHHKIWWTRGKALSHPDVFTSIVRDTAWHWHGVRRSNVVFNISESHSNDVLQFSVIGTLAHAYYCRWGNFRREKIFVAHRKLNQRNIFFDV